MHGIMVPSFFGPFMWDFPKSNEITCVIHRGFYTQTLLHADAFTHTHVHTQTLLHTDAFTHRGFYTQTLLHTDAFTHRHIYTQTLLPTEAFTHTHAFLLHTHTHTFTHRGFYTQTLTQRLYTQKLLHTHIHTHLLRNSLSNYWCGMHRTCKNTSVKPDRHCENGSISWRDGKNHQNDVTTCFATASRCVTTVPFSWRDGQNHQMMWPPAMQQHPGASIRFLFLGETDRITKYVTTSYATASRCITTVPFHGETDRITKWCDHQLCNSIQVHHYGSISWRDGQNHQMMWPPAMQQHPGASLRFHFVARRVESPRAGTRYCVQYLIHQLSPASLARLGQVAPCPLL